MRDSGVLCFIIKVSRMGGRRGIHYPLQLVPAGIVFFFRDIPNRQIVRPMDLLSYRKEDRCNAFGMPHGSRREMISAPKRKKPHKTEANKEKGEKL